MRKSLLAALVVLLAAPAGLARDGTAGETIVRETIASAVIAGVEVDGVTYVDAGALAGALGDVVTAAGGVLTWRGTEGVATFFLGSADALLQRPQDGGPDDWALAAPPLLSEGGVVVDPFEWLLPLDAVQLLGVATTALGEQVYLQLPGGAVLAVVIGTDAGSEQSGLPDATGSSSEVTAVAGVPALRFFIDDDLSLLLLDLDLAPLAYPELTAVIDDAAARAGADQALLALVTSLGQRDWSTSLVFAQDDLSVEVRSPYRFHLYLGVDAVVSPQTPVAGVILLPPAFSLYKPIAVSWAGQTATVTFRH